MSGVSGECGGGEAGGSRETAGRTQHSRFTAGPPVTPTHIYCTHTHTRTHTLLHIHTYPPPPLYIILKASGKKNIDFGHARATHTHTYRLQHTATHHHSNRIRKQAWSVSSNSGKCCHAAWQWFATQFGRHVQKITCRGGTRGADICMLHPKKISHTHTHI